MKIKRAKAMRVCGLIVAPNFANMRLVLLVNLNVITLPIVDFLCDAPFKHIYLYFVQGLRTKQGIINGQPSEDVVMFMHFKYKFEKSVCLAQQVYAQELFPPCFSTSKSRPPLRRPFKSGKAKLGIDWLVNGSSSCLLVSLL